MHKVIVATLVLFVSFVSGCDKEKTAQVDSPSLPEKTVLDTSPVLVRVNGESITEAQVDIVIEKTFSGPQLALAYGAIHKQVLESMISAKLMRQALESELSAEEKLTIHLRTNAYEEELYTKEYLNRHLEPLPVSPGEVKAYYDKHPELFGGGLRKTFQVLAASEKLSASQREQLLADSAKIQQHQNWKKLAENVSADYSLTFTETKVKPEVFGPEVKSVIDGLAEGEVSGFVFINERPHIYKVIDIEAIPPKPLSEVSADILKSLAPINLKNAVKALSDELRKIATIETVAE